MSIIKYLRNRKLSPVVKEEVPIQKEEEKIIINEEDADLATKEDIKKLVMSKRKNRR